ncbi:hypothetical protein UlMin_014117 [Ulmus minor]
MASNLPDEAPNTDTDGEDLALRIKKKRARRVSFADTEITSVHIFNRDEDDDSPPGSKPSSRKETAELEPENELLFGGLADSDDSGDDDDGSVDVSRKSFLRPIGSPSPGSSTVGSATSNDEDNFFGPVSASFIRPGRLSDSTASDVNHEETLDTTAFSLHYRSLARSDSGDLKTPTAVRLAFEEKTPIKNTNPSESGSFMALTEPKKLNSPSMVRIDKVRGGEDDDDMSIVDENPNRYDYSRLSPTLDALLADKDVLDPVTVSNNFKSSTESVQGSPLEQPILLRSTSQQQSVLNTPDSARYSNVLSSSSKQIGSLLSNEYRKHDENILSIQRSISGYRTPGISHSASSIKVGTDKFEDRLAKYASSARLSEKDRKLPPKFGAVPIACLEERLSTADLKSKEPISFVALDTNGVGTPTSTSELGQKSTQSLSREALTQRLSREISDLKAGWKDSTETPSKINPTETPSKINPTETPFTINPTESPLKELTISSLGNEAAQSHSTKEPTQSPDAETSFQRKRSSTKDFLDSEHTNKIPRIQRSPGLQHSNEILDENEKIEGNTTQKHWTDILEKFSRNAKQVLPPSMQNLNLKAIGTVEDILVHLLKVKKYEKLGSVIQSQNVADHFSAQHKRVAEMRFLLYKIVSEKAKLQLLCAKHEKIQKRVHLLRSGIKECQKLKLNIKEQSEAVGKEAQINKCYLQSSSVNFEEHQVASDSVSKMKQKIKDLDRQINSLSNYFRSYCKLKGDVSCDNIVSSVHDNLKRRNRCRFIRQDLQLWKVDGFESQNGHYRVLLNYQGYLNQWFTLNTRSVSSIVVSNQLNDETIVKNFPHIGAHVAFAFVLNAGSTKRDFDAKFLMQETQVTQSLLRNLLDVIEEVQMAQIEISNLIQTSFHSPYAEQLNLQLCFINFGTGIKVTLTLDISCLNSGVYPTEILPYEINSPAAVRKEKLNSLLVEVKAAAENLEVGYARIMRLCKCVSQVLQTEACKQS